MTESASLPSRPVEPPGILPSPELLPAGEIEIGSYRLRFARSASDIDRLLKLRFQVFNLELGEGLEESFATGRDADRFDASCHHMLVEEKGGDLIGTYRMQTAAMATANCGFYSAREFDISDFPVAVVEDSVEVGRACIARDHRSRRVLHLLWRGLARYLIWTGKHRLFGCCSLTTQDRRVGNEVHARLVEGRHLHSDVRAWPLPGFECGLHDQGGEPAESLEIPPLFHSYLSLGAKICGPPAVDRDFGTIDFLVLLDVRELESHVYRGFFG